MAKDKTTESSQKMRPALTPEAREKQLISLAVDLAEKQLREGTASSQVIAHYLKLGSTREKIDNEKKIKEMELMEAKKNAIASTERIEAMYKEALDAMRNYSGMGDPEDD